MDHGGVFVERIADDERVMSVGMVQFEVEAKKGVMVYDMARFEVVEMVERDMMVYDMARFAVVDEMKGKMAYGRVRFAVADEMRDKMVYGKDRFAVAGMMLVVMEVVDKVLVAITA